MPVLDGIAATRRLTESGFGGSIVALTTFDDDESVFEALRFGAVGYAHPRALHLQEVWAPTR